MTERLFSRPRYFGEYRVHDLQYDERRIRQWATVLRETVRPGAVVVEVNAGSGVLSMLAAQAGAAQVFCFEGNPTYAEKVLPANILRNGLPHKIKVNPSEEELPEVDLIIHDFINAGLIGEPLDAIRSLSKFLKKGGQVLPQQARHYVQLMQVQPDLYGLVLPGARWQTLAGDVPLTRPAAFHVTDFNNPGDSPIEINTIATVEAQWPHTPSRPALVGASALANGVKISTRAKLGPGTITGPTNATWLDNIIPRIDDAVSVHYGQSYGISLAYTEGALPEGMAIAVTPA